MIWIIIANGIMFGYLAYVILRRERLLNKAKEVYSDAEKALQNAQKSQSEAEDLKVKVEGDFAYYNDLLEQAKNEKWFRHYAFFPLGNLPVSELSEDELDKVKRELSIVLATRIRKYFELKEVVFKGKRVLMFDLDMKEHKEWTK